MDWLAAKRVEFLTATLSVRGVAEALGVSQGQVKSWKAGEEVPGPDHAGRLLDLDHALALAVQAWTPVVAVDWMTSSNGFLGGARPLDVLGLGDAPVVIAALRATLSGANA